MHLYSKGSIKGINYEVYCYNVLNLRNLSPTLIKWIYEYTQRNYGNRRGALGMSIADAIECLKHFEEEFKNYKQIFKTNIDLYNKNT